MFEYANITWELVWMVALIFNIISYLEKNDKRMFIMLAICSFFYWIHFLWLWLLTAAFINFFDVFKNLIVINHKKNIKLFSLFAVFYVIIWIETGNWEILSYLFTLWSILSLFAAFYFRWISLRVVYLIVTFIYFFYSFAWNSISGMLTSLVFVITLSSSIYVLYKRRWFWWKVRYYKYLLHKKYIRLFTSRHRRLKFLRY